MGSRCVTILDFKERLQHSNVVLTQDKRIEEILLTNIPGAARLEKATLQEDKEGIDVWVVLENGKKIGIDLKTREPDYKLRGKDDIALETWSQVENRVIGWTRDPNKKTDYVLFFWEETGRWCLVPFLMLCSVFQENWVYWKRRTNFQIDKQQSGSWQSESMMVSRRLLWDKILEKFAGPGIMCEFDLVERRKRCLVRSGRGIL